MSGEFAEVNVFMVDENNLTTHIKLILPQNEKLVPEMRRYLKAFNAGGFKPDPSKGPRTYGGGQRQQKPETPPPAGVPVPKHCEEAMVFNEAYTSPKTGKEINARWTCRKAKGCKDANDYGGFTIWADAWQRQVDATERETADPGAYVDPDELPFE